jgi:hypothetical protein
MANPGRPRRAVHQRFLWIPTWFSLRRLLPLPKSPPTAAASIWISEPLWARSPRRLVGSREVATRRPRDICIELPYELAEVIGVRGAHVVVPPRNDDAIAEIRRSLFGRQQRRSRRWSGHGRSATR